MKKLCCTLCAVYALVLFISCENSAVNWAHVDGKIWQLTELGDAAQKYDIPTNVPITLIISDKSIYGYSGINSYTGSLDIVKKSVKLGPFAATMAAGDEKRMNFERAYLRLLEGANSAKIENNSLVLSNKKEKTRLAFGEFVLAGTKWQLTGYNTGNAIVSDKLCENAFISFDTTETVSGNTGFNNFKGTYSAASRESMLITLIGMTKMAPPPEAAWFEQLFTDFLTRAKKYSCDGNSLRLLDEDDSSLLVFRLTSH